jgi:hypothetical protein
MEAKQSKAERFRNEQAATQAAKAKQRDDKIKEANDRINAKQDRLSAQIADRHAQVEFLSQSSFHLPSHDTIIRRRHGDLRSPKCLSHDAGGASAGRLPGGNQDQGRLGECQSEGSRIHHIHD